MELKKFYYIECSDDILSIDDIIEILKDGCGTAPILWYNEGLYKLIHPAMIANLSAIYNVVCKLSASSNPIGVRIYWDEIIDVPADIARCLLAEILEDKNQQSNSSSSSDAQ